MEDIFMSIIEGIITCLLLFAVFKHFDNVETIKNNTSNCYYNQIIEEEK